MAERIAFRNRAHEVSRLEAFSDVIFGFAVSLLVVSLEAPKSYGELREMMHGFLPFGIAFFVLIDVWWEHHHFFRRYALSDDGTIRVLNTVLLFVILFYVYPLKYVFTLSVESMFGHPSDLTPAQAANLFAIYGLGFAAVFVILGLMYRHASTLGDKLQLNDVERNDTMESIYDNFATAAFGIFSAMLGYVLPPRLVGVAGLIYFFLMIPKTLIPMRFRRRRRALEAAMLAPQTPG